MYFHYFDWIHSSQGLWVGSVQALLVLQLVRVHFELCRSVEYRMEAVGTEVKSGVNVKLNYMQGLGFCIF